MSVRFFNDTETLLAGDLRGIRGWLDKLRLYQWRIAALLHLAEAVPVDGEAALGRSIGADTMQRAEAICRWYIPQASRAFGLPRIDELADEILDAAHERNAFLRLGFSKRDMLRATKRRADELAPALERLVEGGHLVAERIGGTVRTWAPMTTPLLSVARQRAAGAQGSGRDATDGGRRARVAVGV